MQSEAEFTGINVSTFLTDLQEATRANPSGREQFYVSPMNGEIAAARYHHFIFGQRGSGKSSLLRHLQEKQRSQGRASVWVDQEIFSSLSYPDVLVSVVREVVSGVKSALEAQQDPEGGGLKSRLKGIFSKKSDERILVEKLERAESQLYLLKFSPNDSKVEWVIERESGRSGSANVGLKAEIVSGQVAGGKNSRSLYSQRQVVEGSKDEFLERALPDFRALISGASNKVGGGFIFVDDLYQIARESQPLVLGYLHRLVKDTGLWLKVGSIRYSTVNYKPGDPPRGMQIGHDAHEVALDRGLRHFSSAQQFLEEILSKIAEKSSVDIKKLFTEDARKRLVLAAGGVARDYLRLASGSIAEARNRGVTEKSGSHRVIVEDVNQAAGQISPSKFNDLRTDEPAEASELQELVQELTDFCRRNKSAYFLVARDDEISEKVNKLQHLRFAHLLVESETVPDRGSQRFNVWLLDVAELSAQRATQGMDFLKWENRENRRKRGLIFSRSVDGNV
ncbi:hypothetical protein [Nocardiopsis valliformis]|uniref:hypothetical protein n=1 Tax=Nocardiopsis valliformis TaxID=239974 RepID=UPI001268C4A4|nr:hypothetical protein [Nocardiopsis valliformis]